MAFGNGNNNNGNGNGGFEQTMVCTNWRGHCYKMKQINDSCIVLECTFGSRLRDKNDRSKGYIDGLHVDVYCTIAGDNLTDIPQDNYEGKSVAVNGRLYATENTGKDGKVYTNWRMTAASVREVVYKDNNNNGGGWGNQQG